MFYSIVNAFLNNITFSDPDVEALLLAALDDETCLTPAIYRNVVELFSYISSTTQMA